jgi:PAS domain S-box-containing protein
LNAAAATAVGVLLYLLSRSNYLLFHGVIELFGVVVCFAIFVVAWNTRRWVSNHFLLFLGIAYLFVAAVGIFHTLAYRGMGVFPGYTTDEPAQFWVLARYLEAFSLLLAPLFLTRRLRPARAFVAFSLVTGFGLLSVCRLGVFPECFVEGQGLTPFKVVSEYVISAVLLAAVGFLYRRRAAFEPRVFRFLAAGIIAGIAAEMTFTLYADAYGIANAAGHLLKAASFYLVYRAVVVTSLVSPIASLFRDLAQERDRAQRYLDVADVVLIVVGRDGRIQLINRKGAEVLGLPVDEIVGRDWFRDFLPDSRRGKALELFASLMEGRTETAERSEGPVLTRQGGERTIAWHNSVLRDESGAVVGMLSSGEDVTEQRAAEQALAASRQRLQLLFDRAPDGYYLSDLDGRFVDANRAAEDLVGYRKEELLGKSYLDAGLLRPQDVPAAAALLRRSMQGLPTGPDELTLVREDGRAVVVEIRTEPVDVEGRPLILGIARDVTERKVAERALRESEERYRRLFEEAIEGVFVLDLEGRLTSANPALVDLLDMAPKDAIGKGFSELLAPDSAGWAVELFTKLATTHEPVREFPAEVTLVNGRHLWAELYASQVYVGGVLVGMQGTVRDISKRKLAEARVREASERLERAMSVGNLAWWQMTLPSGDVLFDARKATMLGHRPSDFSHYRDFTALLHPDDSEKTMQAMRDHLEGRAERYEAEYRLRTATGLYRWLRDVGSVTQRDASGRPSVVTGIVVDITNLKETQERLVRSNAELQDLAARLDVAREEERAEVAWELHDQIAQSLAVMKMDVDSCRRRLPPDVLVEVRPSLDVMFSLLDDTIARLRRLYTDLVPVMLEDLGLAATIEWQAEEFRRKRGIDIEVRRVEEVTLLDRRTELGVFRVLQEALDNVALHAGATKVTVDFGRDDGHAVLCVSDNGVVPAGTAEDGAEGMEFAGIRERVRSWGGSVAVSTSPAAGTSLRVTAPLSRK